MWAVSCGRWLWSAAFAFDLEAVPEVVGLTGEDAEADGPGRGDGAAGDGVEGLFSVPVGKGENHALGFFDLASAFDLGAGVAGKSALRFCCLSTWARNGAVRLVG